MKFSGRFLARYAVVKKLGQGGMGEVMLARDQQLDRLVAVKTILAGYFDRSDSRERFLGEARTTSRFSHPAIIRVLDQGEEEDFLYLVLEFVAGGDLAQLLTRTPRLPPDLFFKIAVPVLEGVAHAHGAGVLHRDIKASNIFLDDELRPRIADFGLAKDQTNLGVRTATGVIMGTPTYMAPELALGKRAVAASDQYALGILLYEMLTGRPPFAAEQMMALLRMHLDETATPLSKVRRDVPAKLAAAIHRALAKSAEERWPSVDAFAVAVREVEASGADAWVMPPAGGETVVAQLTPGATVSPTARAPGAKVAPIAASPGATAGPPPRTPATTIPPAATPPAATIVPAAETSGQARSTGRTRIGSSGSAQRPRPSIKVVAPAPPAPARIWLWSTLLAIVALAVAGSVIGWRMWSPRPKESETGTPSSPGPVLASPTAGEADVAVTVHRRFATAMLTWDFVATAARATRNGVPASARSTSSLVLYGLNGDDQQVSLELDHPSLGTRHWSGHIGAVARATTLEKLQGYRPQQGRLTKVGSSWEPPEAEIYRKFAAELGPDLSLNLRYLAAAPRRMEKAAKQSNLSDFMLRHGDPGLIDALQQACDLLDQPGFFDENLKLWAEAQQLADLETFCWLHGLAPSPKPPCVEAIRFVFALGPGPIPVSASPGSTPKPLLGGSGNYSRRRWFQRLVGRGDLPGVNLEEPVSEPHHFDALTRSLLWDFEQCVRAHSQLLQVSGKSDRLVSGNPTSATLPIEFVADQTAMAVAGADQSWEGDHVLMPVRLEKPDLLTPPSAPEHVLQAIAYVTATEHSHVQLRFPGVPTAVRMQVMPGLAASKHDRCTVLLSCIVDSEVLHQAKDGPVEISSHTFPGEGSFTDAREKNTLRQVEVKIRKVILRLVTP